MGKIKSAICLTLITLIIAVLCALSTVSFEYDSVSGKAYNSFVSYMRKDAGFGNELKNGSYVGGGYVSVYYPEGVISAEEYEANLSAYGSDTEGQKKYEDKYSAHESGALYLEKEVVLNDEGTAVSDTFKKSFSDTVQALKERFEAKHITGVKLEVCDEYTIRVTLPAAESSASTILSYFAYTGELTMAYGSETATIGDSSLEITDYIKGFSSMYSQDTAYLVVDFTKEGRALIKETTAGAADSSSTLYFMVGENAVISLTVSEEIDQASLYISGSYTKESAEVVAVLLEQTLTGTQTDLAVSLDNAVTYHADFGDNATMFVYIGFGVFFLAMVIFFLVRYHALGIAHIYGYLVYLICMILCLAFIPSFTLSFATIAAVAVSSIVLCVSNAVAFEYAKKEYELRKSTFVKTGYKKCFWHLFDLHIVLAIAAVLVGAIALAQLQMFAWALALGVAFSGVCVLAITRFMWYITMPFSKNQGKFCNFKRGEDVDDD